MRAKCRKVGASGILDRAVAADPTGSDETNVSSAVPVPDPPGLVANAQAIRRRARGHCEPKTETDRAAMSRDPRLRKRSSLRPFKWTSCRKNTRSAK
jgi:hypothetical protein